MGLLRPIIVFKDKVMEAILTSEQVVRLIDDPQFNTVPAIGLKYKKVFPYAYVPQMIDDASSIVCFEANISSISSDTVCDVQLNFWILCQCSVIETPEGAREDLLADAVDELVNHSRDFGIGKVTPYYRDPVTYTIPNYDYVCRKLSYTIKDFNFRFGARQ